MAVAHAEPSGQSKRALPVPLRHPRHDLSAERTGWVIPSAGHPTYGSQPGRVQTVYAVDAGRRAQKHRFCPWRFCGNELCCRAVAVAPGALRAAVHERPGSQIARPPAARAAANSPRWACVVANRLFPPSPRALPAGTPFLTSAGLRRLQRTCARRKSQLCLISVQSRMVMHQIKLDVRGC